MEKTEKTNKTDSYQPTQHQIYKNLNPLGYNNQTSQTASCPVPLKLRHYGAVQICI